jgi:hypothetical protein
MVAAGIDKKIIARVIGCTLTELENFHSEELELGLATANARVVRNVYNLATSNSKQAMTAAAFWLKNRAGWKEKATHELTGADGNPIETAQVDLSPETLDRIRSKYIGDSDSD